jgi:hypothetical protein
LLFLVDVDTVERLVAQKKHHTGRTARSRSSIFGLAKLDAPAKAGALTAGANTLHAGPGFSRAVTSPAMTMQGMILGTAAYLSPVGAQLDVRGLEIAMNDAGLVFVA